MLQGKPIERSLTGIKRTFYKVHFSTSTKRAASPMRHRPIESI